MRFGRRMRRAAVWRVGGLALAGAGLLVSMGIAQMLGSPAASAAGLQQAPVLQQVWRVQFTDLANGVHQGIALGSPAIATLTDGPTVVVGDRAGKLYGLNLATGATAPGWPKTLGVGVTSTPSVFKRPGTTYDTVLVGSGWAADACAGGYNWVLPTGAQDLVKAPNPTTDHPCKANGVFAGISLGTLGGVTGAVAGTLGQETDAMNATTRAVLPGFPWFQADSNFATPAIADVVGSGANQIVEGGAQTAGTAYRRHYTQGGHIRILNASGGLMCEDTTTESINSSPAVGKFLPGSGVGIVAGTGPTFPTSPQHDEVMAVNTSCQQVWATKLTGTTGYESPALADVLGNGQLQVLVTTRSGGVWALNGATGAAVWHAQLAHEIFGSPVTTQLGTGQQIVVVATINGFDVLTGVTGSVLVATQMTSVGFQNAPIITKDANGTIGITVAGYQPDDAVVLHYEIVGSDNANVDSAGTWPQFHHDPQLTGNADVASSPFTTYTRISGSTPDATAAAELQHQFDAALGDCPGTSASTRPVVLATDKTFPDALASAPLARSLATGTLLTAATRLSGPTAAALSAEGITHVVVVGGPLAVSTAVVATLESTPSTQCGGVGQTGADISVTRVAGVTANQTAALIAAASDAGAGSLDLAGAYAGTDVTGGQGRYNDTAGSASSVPVASGTLPTAILASSREFQDAEAASTLAYAERLPILLTTPTSLAPQASAQITALGIQQVLVTGGQLAVSDAVVSSLQAMGVSVLRVAGQDATDTAVQLADLETAPSPTGVGWSGTGSVAVAQAAYFSDGLAGAVVAADGPTAQSPEPLLLTENPTAVGAPLTAFLHLAGSTGIGGAAVKRFTVLGGPLAVTVLTVNKMGADL